jgi:serine/threonine-protein kinase
LWVEREVAVPELRYCLQCSQAIPADAPAGMCPACLLRLGLQNTPRTQETPLTPDPNSTGDHSPEPTNATTAELVPNPDTTGLLSPARQAGRVVSAVPPREGPVILGNLDVYEEIGHGGMGVVYRARQRIANREVAVKVLSGNLAARGAAERFSGEIEALAGLRHPNIVEVYEVGEDSGCVYFAMELVPGGTLAGRAKRELIEPAAVAAIIEQLAEAVHAAHVVGLLHRDIKPANVLLTVDGIPKLSDFGLAKWMDREDGLTETGAVLGTPSYMAPEQAVGSKHGTLGPPTDVYGLGATLYELLTGKPPFRAASTFETLQRVIHEQPVAPRVLCPAVHPDLEAVCLKCLEKDPARRYASAQELANDLHRWRVGDSTRARPLSRLRRLWRVVRRQWRWIGATAIAAAIAIGIFIAMKRPPTAEEAMEAHLERLGESLRRGEQVTLIGETGAPKYHRWGVGMGEAGEQGAGKQFMVFAAEFGLVELLPDTQTDRYRFSAEFRVDGSLARNSYGGIYFAHQQCALGGGVGVDRAVVVRFSDDHLTSKPAFQLKGKQLGEPSEFDEVSLEDDLYYLPPTGHGIKGLIQQLGYLRVVDPIDPRSGLKLYDQLPWRQIVATVKPDELHVQWRDPDGTYRPVGLPDFRKPSRPIPRSKLTSDDENIKGFLTQTYPGIDTSGFTPHSSRGGVGLYVYSARVFFRNVVVEPLP